MSVVRGVDRLSSTYDQIDADGSEEISPRNYFFAERYLDLGPPSLSLVRAFCAVC